MDPAFLTIAELNRLYAQRKLSPVEATKALLARIAAHDDKLHSFLLVTEEEAPKAGLRMQNSEQEQKLQWAIQQLPENQKQVLLLRYYGNLKFVDIAEMVGCPLNTALGRMHKAMMKLKQIMEQ